MTDNLREGESKGGVSESPKGHSNLLRLKITPEHKQLKLFIIYVYIVDVESSSTSSYVYFFTF